MNSQVIMSCCARTEGSIFGVNEAGAGERLRPHVPQRSWDRRPESKLNALMVASEQNHVESSAIAGRVRFAQQLHIEAQNESVAAIEGGKRRIDQRVDDRKRIGPTGPSAFGAGIE